MSKKNKPTAKSSSPNLIDHLIKYVFAASLIFIPLYPKFPLLTIPGTYVAIRSEDFIIAVLALLLLTRIKFFLSLFKKEATSKSILIYIAIGLMSVLSGIFVTKTAQLHIGMLHWARRIEYFVPFFAGLYLMRFKNNLRFFMELIPLVALGVFAYGIAQIYFQAPVIITQNEEYSKGLALTLQPGVNLASTFAGHYDLATYLVMTLSIILSSIFIFKNKLIKLLGVTYCVVLFWLQLRTGSRIAFFALVSSLSLVLLFQKKKALIIPLVIVAGIGLANTPSIAGRFQYLFNVFQFKYLQEKVKGAFDSRTGFLFVEPVYAQEESTPPAEKTETLRPIQQDRSTSIRLDVEWPRAIRALTKNPFLGTGYSSINLSTDNDYLRSLGEVGLIGFFAWISIIINVITSLIKGLKTKLAKIEKSYIIGILGAVSGFLVIAIFIDVFEASKVATLFWAYTGMATGLIIKNTDK